MNLSTYETEERLRPRLTEIYENTINDFSLKLNALLSELRLSFSDENTRNAIVRLVGYDILDAYDDWRNNGRTAVRGS